LGRTLRATDDREGAALAVVLSDAIWRDRYGRDPGVIGKAIHANAQPATIVGVMPPGFAFPYNQAVWIPARLPANGAIDLSFNVMARLADGARVDAARAEFEAFTQRFREADPRRLDGLQPWLREAAYRFVSAHTRSLLWLMFAAGAFVLLLACLNTANLGLAQAAARQREFAVRCALGAGRRRIVLGQLAESLILSLIATGLALVFANAAGRWTLDMLIAADDAPAYWLDFTPDARLYALAFAVALVVTLVAGLAPALRAAEFGAGNATLRDGARAGGAGFARFSRGLVIGEIALSCVLLIAAGVSVRVLQSMLSFEFGTHTDPAQVLTARIALFPEAFPTGAAQIRFFEQVVERVRAEPGVIDATAANVLPGNIGGGARVLVEGEPVEDSIAYQSTGVVDARFAATYGVNVVAGRFFGAQDTAESLPVAVVDRRFVERRLGGREPLGTRINLDPGNDQSPWRTIVGVVEPLHLDDVDDDVQPTALVPMSQEAQRFVSIAVHLRGDAPAFGTRLAQIVREIDADTPIYWVHTQQRAIDLGRVGPDLLARIFGGFGVLGLVLAAAGLYGVLAFAVSERTREIGLRRAIGAQSGDVLRAVAGRSAWQVALGLGLGLALGIPFGLMLGGETEDGGFDVVVLLLACGTIMLAAVLAAMLPTRRALAVDPMVALRYE
jgi:predicted permease